MPSYCWQRAEWHSFLCPLLCGCMLLSDISVRTIVYDVQSSTAVRMFPNLNHVLGDECIYPPLVQKFIQWCILTMYSLWHWGQGLYKVFLTDLLFLCSDETLLWVPWPVQLKFACLDTKWVLMPDVIFSPCDDNLCLATCDAMSFGRGLLTLQRTCCLLD